MCVPTTLTGHETQCTMCITLNWKDFFSGQTQCVRKKRKKRKQATPSSMTQINARIYLLFPI